MRVVIPGFVLLSLWFLAPASVAACSCVDVQVEDALRTAAAVFEGRVDEVSEPDEGRRTVVVSVTRAWKGVEVERLTLSTAEHAATCGYRFALGAAYLIYADREAGALTVNSCSRTRPIAQADEDLAKLGAGVVPVQPQPPKGDEAIPQPLQEPPAAGGCAGCRVHQTNGGLAPGPLAVLIAGLLFIRRRR